MRTSLRQLVSVVVSVVILAFVAGACEAVDSPAVRVGDWELGRSEFSRRLKELADNEPMVQLLGLTPYTDSNRNSFSTQYTAVLLNLHVSNQILVKEAERRGLSVDRDAAELSLINEIAGAMAQQQFQATSGGLEGQAQLLLDNSGWLKDELITSGAYSSALQADFAKATSTDEALRDLYNQLGDQLAEACARHILVAATDDDAADLAKAQDLKSQLTQGADFAVLAEQSSDDTGSASNGGDLGCAAKGTYVAEFDDAVWSGEVGVVSDPVKTSFGYHLIEVTKRGRPTFDEARPDLEQAMVQQAGEALQKWLSDSLMAADVFVDPRFGDWDPQTGFVMPPAGAVIPTTTTTLGTEPSIP